MSASWAMVLTSGPIVIAPQVPAFRNWRREIFFRFLDMALTFDVYSGEKVSR